MNTLMKNSTHFSLQRTLLTAACGLLRWRAAQRQAAPAADDRVAATPSAALKEAA